MVEKAYLRSRMKEVAEGIKEIQRLYTKPFGNLSLDEKYSVRYQIIIIAESIGSIALHICLEEFEYHADSYAGAITYLERKNVITNSHSLVQILRLRNLVVHRYWVIDDAQIYTSVKNNFQAVNLFLKTIGEFYGL